MNTILNALIGKRDFRYRSEGQARIDSSFEGRTDRQTDARVWETDALAWPLANNFQCEESGADLTA